MAYDPTRFLDQLASTGAAGAWKTFLEHYAPLIFQISRKYEYDDDRVADLFVFVCEELSQDEYRRLRSYETDGPAQFTSWLSIVISNLCIDFHRTQYGRSASLRAINELPLLDKLVFRCIFEQGMGMRECMHTLQTQFPDLTEKRLSNTVGSIHSLLSPRRRWLLSTPRGKPGAADNPVSFQDVFGDSEPPDRRPGPDKLSELAEQRSTLIEAMSHLTSFQRVLLRLRYQDDLSLKEVARLTGLGDPYRARRQIQAALKALADAFADA